MSKKIEDVFYEVHKGCGFSNQLVVLFYEQFLATMVAQPLFEQFKKDHIEKYGPKKKAVIE